MVVGMSISLGALTAQNRPVTSVLPATEGMATGTTAAFGAAFGMVTPVAAFSGAVGISSAVGAVTGALLSGDMDFSVGSAIIGGATAAGIAGIGGGCIAAAQGAFLAPLGLFVLGAANHNNNDVNHGSGNNTESFDCWKPVLHDTSLEPSKGMLLRDVVLDKRIKFVRLISEEGNKTSYRSCSTTTTSTGFPRIHLRNIWEEDFTIDFVMLPSGQIAAHAVQMLESQS